MGFLFGGERGIQTPGTDEPFTGFRVRPNRSLWHLSWVQSCDCGCKGKEKFKV